ncbi:MAG: putative methyltransferase [Gammaproteobacteria bacterium]|jgi:L-histidine N-alpha-methyltransferase|nr:putative methyltransferase [Gammaproteobacteria bacterium]
MQTRLRLPGTPAHHGADWRVAAPSLVADVLRGLQGEPKRLSPTYFYDERGSQLFDEICELPEYYITRTETRILERHAQAIADRIGENALLVELGSGASTKTRLLLDRLPDLAAYVPVDISRTHLMAAAQRIASAYPGLEVLPACADFTQAFPLPRSRRTPSRVVVFFPGSTIGNFDPPAAIELMKVMRRIATGAATARLGSSPGTSAGGLVIGFDLVKDPAILERAYDDSAGVTAEFNLNVLRRLNRDLGADFDLQAFSHEAIWVPEANRIEMRLVSKVAQTVTIAGEAISFAADERIVTEHCHKYTPGLFAAQAGAAGWTAQQTWTDERNYFHVQYLEQDLKQEQKG